MYSIYVENLRQYIPKIGGNMSYETVIAQVRETPAEFLEEVSTFLSFLKFKSQQNKKSFDENYNRLVTEISSDVTSAAKATIWEQIKDDTW